MSLRGYQQDILRITKEKYQEGVCKQLVVLPTGCGKTVVFAHLPQMFPKRMLVLVHREELADQAADKISKWNPTLRVGIEMGDRVARSDSNVVVGSVQTLGREGSKRLTALNADDFSVVVIDECHHAIASGYKNVLRHFGLHGDSVPRNGRLLWGCTATPNRGDNLGLAQIFDDIVYQYSMFDAIKDGWLADVRGIRVRTGVELDDVHTSMGDFQQNELSDAVNTPQRNDLIVREWLARAEERQTIAFTVDIQHAKDLADSFKRYGVAAEAVWGDDPDRASKLARHRTGDIRVLANCGLMTEGHDDPKIACVIHARPTKSKLLFIQMTGRGTRIPEGINNLVEARAAGVKVEKEDCLLMDVADNTTRHSLVTLNSIFGLPPKLDLKGMSAIKALSTIESATLGKDVDLSGLEDIAKLDYYVQEVDLFKVKYAQEVLDNSENQWHATPMGNYVMVLPDKERITITKDLLDHWKVTGTVEGTSFSEAKAELSEAFHYADGMLKFLGRSLLTLTRRDSTAKWRSNPVTDKQKNAIYWVCRKRGIPQPNFAQMTSGQANQFLSANAARR